MVRFSKKLAINSISHFSIRIHYFYTTSSWNDTNIEVTFVPFTIIRPFVRIKFLFTNVI